MNNLQTSQIGIDLIKEFESLHDGEPNLPELYPHLDPVGIWTEGYGLAMIDPATGKFLRDIENKEKAYGLRQIKTKEQAEESLKKEVIPREKSINRLVKVHLCQHQFDALVSFVYNVGTGAFESSTLLRVLNQGKYTEAAEQFLRWNKAGGKVFRGLTRRREAERKLFLS